MDDWHAAGRLCESRPGGKDGRSRSNGGLAMDLRTCLDEMHCHYEWSPQPDDYTHTQLAHREHVSGRHVIKPVLVKIDGEFVLCALPAACRVDLSRLRA